MPAACDPLAAPRLLLVEGEEEEEEEEEGEGEGVWGGSEEGVEGLVGELR